MFSLICFPALWTWCDPKGGQWMVKNGSVSLTSRINSITSNPFLLFSSFLAFYFAYHLSLVAESRSGCGSPDHHPCSREGHRLLQALHDPGREHPLPQAQWHQPQRLLLPQPPITRHLDVCAPCLPGGQLCPLCHCEVRAVSPLESWP